MSSVWSYRLEHLERLSTSRGILEHALGSQPRHEHGYCTDDNSRLMIVLSREPDENSVHRMFAAALNLVLDAQEEDGLIRNRYGFQDYWSWTDAPSAEDCWGRAMWSFGVVAATHSSPAIRVAAHWAFEKGAQVRSPWRRAMAFAALGAADLLLVDTKMASASALLSDSLELIATPMGASWKWPESRLTYANGALAEALIAGGTALRDHATTEHGLELLDWLMTEQTSDGHLSVVGHRGRGPQEHGPQFDQQPIEVAALADACWRAWKLTGDPRWAAGLASCADWFMGANDSHTPMFDAHTAGGYDGLEIDGRNINQGAESTMAYVSTMQRARALLPWSPLLSENRLARV